MESYISKDLASLIWCPIPLWLLLPIRLSINICWVNIWQMPEILVPSNMQPVTFQHQSSDLACAKFWVQHLVLQKKKKIKIERIERKNGYWSHIFSKPNYKEKYMYIFSHCHESECEEVQFAYSCFTVCNLWWTKEVVVIALLLTYLHNKKTKSTSIK